MLLVLACAGLVVLLAAGCSGVMGSVANNVYPSLAQPEETEAPPTFTTYLPSAATQAILGGRGQGLNCSIPPLLARLAFTREGNESDVSLRFRQACVMHDMCYRHGYATYRYTQADCDMMLQQSAFRLCRQIYRPVRDSTVDNIVDRKLQDEALREQKERPKSARQRAYDGCETEAKKVLLGVTLGGGGSYLAADRSTYFEYDPMPAHADDYVIGRAVSMADDRDKDDIGIRPFYVWLNTVELTFLTRPSPAAPGLGRRRAGPALFPQRLVATPPMLIATGSPMEQFAALARSSFGNTDLTVVTYHTRERTSGREPGPAFSLSACAGGSESPCVSATDASIRKLAVIDARPVLLSLTHRGTLRGVTEAEDGAGSTVKIVQKSLAGMAFDDAGSRPPSASGNAECMAGTFSAMGADGRLRCVMDDYPLNGARLITDKYRFLQHDVLLEQDGVGNATHAWVLGRGVALTSSAGVSFVTESPGEGYASKIVVVRQALGNGKHDDTQRFSLNVSEADEPLSLVRLGQAEGASLIGLAWKKDDLSRVEDGKPPASAPVLKLWTMPVPGQPPGPQPLEIALPQQLKDRFIDIPPAVVRLSGVDSPLFVFARVDDPLSQGALDEQSAAGAAKVVRLRFHVLTLGSVGAAAKALADLGEFSCLIDLEKQWQLPAAAQIRTRAFRALVLNENEWERNHPHVLPADVRERIVRDLSYRWRMSQVIASERLSEDGKSLLALTTVFNGFPALSTQMLLRPQDNGLRLVQEGACIGAP